MARTAMPRSRNSSVTRLPVLPCCPPAAPVTNTVMALSHHCGTDRYHDQTVWYRRVPRQGRAMTEVARSDPPAAEAPVRHRILDAAFATFTEAGYAATTMLEIARRA